MDITDVVSSFRAWGGTDYRIDKNEEPEKYDEFKKADRGVIFKDNSITLEEFLNYYCKPQITYKNIETVRYIDIAIHTASKKEAISAITHLGNIGDDAAVMPLYDLMTYSSPTDKERQQAIITALTKIGTEKAAIALLNILGSFDSIFQEIEEEIVKDLHSFTAKILLSVLIESNALNISDSQRNDLVANVKIPKSNVRFWLNTKNITKKNLSIFKTIADKMSVSQLLECLDVANPLVNNYSISCLNSKKDISITSAIVHYLKGLKAESSMTEGIVQFLNYKNDLIRNEVMKELREIVENSTVPLLKKLLAVGSTKALQEALPLLRALQSDSQVLLATATTQDLTLWALLLQTATAQDHAIRHEALHTLASLNWYAHHKNDELPVSSDKNRYPYNENEQVCTLPNEKNISESYNGLHLLNISAYIKDFDDNNAAIREETLRDIYWLNDTRAFTKLKTIALSNIQGEISSLARSALMRYKTPEAFRALLEIYSSLSTKDQKTSEQLAINAFTDGALNSNLALLKFKVLQDAVNDPREKVRLMSLVVLTEIIRRYDLAELNPVDKKNRQLLALLNNTELFNTIVNTLSDSNWDIRCNGVIILGHLKNKKALPYICNLLLHDSNENVRTWCCRALFEFNDPNTLPTLEKALKRENPAIEYGLFYEIQNVIKTIKEKL